MASLVSGEAPVGAVGGSEAMSAAAGGAEVAVIAVLVPVSPWSLYVPASVKSAAELKGQRVGVVTAGGSADIAARAGLSKIGLAADQDVTITPAGSTENLNSALANGAVQGAMLTPPYSFIFQDKGFHSLFDLAELKLPSADTGIVAQRAYLTGHRETVQRYIDAIVEGIKREKQDKAF
jgi:NitT/TauT family transport system substrate-binding protein